MKEISVNPGPGNTLLDEYGKQVAPPSNWFFLPAGDAGLTRKVTARGRYWRVQVKKGRRTINKGVWAPAEIIAAAKAAVEEHRNTQAYKKKREYETKRRAKQQEEYVSDFCLQVRRYLNFAPCYKHHEQQMAALITAHATPVGSGTVARTTKIPIGARAKKAVIAWMRHATTAYDNMKIARVKGRRRELRASLATESLQLLDRYRSGHELPENCPLLNALQQNKPR